MQQEKENKETVEKQFEMLKDQLEQDRVNKEMNVMQAVQDLETIGCLLNTRRLYFDMCLQYAGDSKNGVDDDDRLNMLSLFEVLNVM